jgi:hypothetical protein
MKDQRPQYRGCVHAPWSLIGDKRTGFVTPALLAIPIGSIIFLGVRRYCMGLNGSDGFSPGADERRQYALLLSFSKKVSNGRSGRTAASYYRQFWIGYLFPFIGFEQVSCTRGQYTRLS